MARIELQQLNVLYRLEDFRAEGTTSSMAVLSVHINSTEAKKMSGNWVVLGSDSHGDIIFSRPPK